MRACSKRGCSEEAAATVALSYGARQVEIVDLISEREPGLLELCASHAAGLSPPLGWRVSDRRAASRA